MSGIFAFITAEYANQTIIPPIATKSAPIKFSLKSIETNAIIETAGIKRPTDILELSFITVFSNFLIRSDKVRFKLPQSLFKCKYL